MAETGVRVALLARAGKARDQLHRALLEAQAVIVAEGDPAELDPAQVSQLAPTVFLVSLEPAVEAALERFDSLLSAQGVEVMFDDAEVTARLDGWDLNRWARHVAAKLVGSEGLPPVPEDAPAWPDIELTPGAPPTPAEMMDDARLEDYTADVSELADSVPMSQSLAASPVSELDFDLDSLDFLHAPSPLPVVTASPVPAEPDFAELDLSDSVSFSSFDAVESDPGDLAGDVAELAAQLASFEKNAPGVSHGKSSFSGSLDIGGLDFDSGGIEMLESIEVIEPAAARVAETVAAAAGPAVSFDFSNLMLAPMEESPAVASAPVAQAQAAVSSLSLLEDAPLAVDAGSPTAAVGIVLVLAGLGGPDAVRQLLSSLSENLPVPVLLYQHLEVGKHERLVDQLAKISRLPVALAQDGGSPQTGRISLLPAGLTASRQGPALVFTAGSLTGLIASLPPAESVIVVLSGTDPLLVPAIIAAGEAGALVLAQDPEVCFDAAAAEAMQAQGAAVYPALGLARQIAARWST